MASVFSLGVIDIPDASLAERIAYVGWSEGGQATAQNLEGSTRVPLGVYDADPDRHCPWCLVVEEVLQTPEGEEAVKLGTHVLPGEGCLLVPRCSHVKEAALCRPLFHPSCDTWVGYQPHDRHDNVATSGNPWFRKCERNCCRINCD